MKNIFPPLCIAVFHNSLSTSCTVYIKIYSSSNLPCLWERYSSSVSLAGMTWWRQSFSRTDLNSKFSFSETSCYMRVIEPNVFSYLPKDGGRIVRLIPLPDVLEQMWNSNNRAQELNSSPLYTWSTFYDDIHCATCVVFLAIYHQKYIFIMIIYLHV